MNTTPADVETAIKDLVGRDRLYQRLRDLITEQGTTLESTIGSHTKHLAPPIPWNEPAALLYMDIHAGAREHEANLTLMLFARAVFRGPADTLTVTILERLAVLLAAAHDAGRWDHHVVQNAAAQVTRWPVLVRRLLDESRPSEIPWTRAPGGLRCPHCASVLQLPPGWQYAGDRAEVVCRNPECRDDDGHRRQWAADAWLGRLNDETEPPDPDELITMERAKQENPHIRRNTFAVWKWRAVNVPASAPVQVQAHTPGGEPLFRRGDVDTALQSRAS